MAKKNNLVKTLFDLFLSEDTRLKTEKIILKVALVSFFIHLAIIYLMKFDFLNFSSNSELFND
jgi:hypothetical protein